MMPPLHIYTDGACDPNPGQGGWGFVVYDAGREIEAQYAGDPETTNNIMEMTALLAALKWCLEQPEIGRVTIHSDSAYVVNGLNSWRHNWKRKGWKRGPNKPLLNAELWQELSAAADAFPTAKIVWVKGHAGIEGNERADELAAMGMEGFSAKLTAIEEQLGERFSESKLEAAQ